MQPWRPDQVLKRRQPAGDERFGRDHLRDGGRAVIRTGRPGGDSTLPKYVEHAAGSVALHILAGDRRRLDATEGRRCRCAALQCQGLCVNPADPSAKWSIASPGETVLSVAS